MVAPLRNRQNLDIFQGLPKIRAAAIVLYGTGLAAWFYAEQRQLDLYSQQVYDVLHGTAFTVGFAILLPILIGWLVGRPWALLALIAPFAALACLQITGYVSPWHDGSPPLGISSLMGLFWTAALLLLGFGLHSGFAKRRPASQGTRHNS